MKPRRLPRAKPHLPEEDVAVLLEEFGEILRSGRLTRGLHLDRFEREFAACAGVKYAVGLSSGTAPLEIALRFWQVEGREVIVPTNTFVASANAVLLAGGIPVLADISPACLSSSCAQIEARLTPRTRGVMVVHLAGIIPPEIAEVRQLCRERGLFLLEDAAHAHGASWRGRPAGSLGDAAGFSFFPTKVITCGEGGMLTTDDLQLADFARSYRCHGLDGQSGELVRLGNNYRLPELSAALGVKQLARLEEFVGERNCLAAHYLERLARMPGLGLFPPLADQVHSYYKFPVLLPSGCDRQQLAQCLQEEFGVETGSAYWPPCHHHPLYCDRFPPALFPMAEDLLPRILTLPLFVGLEEADIDWVCSVLQGVLARRGD
ncbi:MAG: DegT/DnrJ/EryC1/StrS family aminotransferase [Candidatus Latescibacteria bacterium]|nr:DegT/DnrJ/EryC1/StrS family aminotransferase [Candidatus Latescibacterota bacterium]